MESSSFLPKSIAFIVLFSTFCVCNAGLSTVVGAKVKRGDKEMGLYPFPRVGRSGGGSGSGAIHLANTDIFDSSDLLHEMKRQNLMAFPRVGRDNFRSIAAADTGLSNGLWWGPRLGRFQKRSGADAPWVLVSLKDFHLPHTRDVDFTPRLGRESEEDEENAAELIDEMSRLSTEQQPNPSIK